MIELSGPAREIRTLFSQWARSVGDEKDLNFLERHLSDDWIYVDLFGTRRTKQEYFGLVSKIDSYEQDVREFHVTMESDTVAVVNGKYRARAVLADGKAHDNTIAFSAVWRLASGRWMAVLVHTTRISAGSF